MGYFEPKYSDVDFVVILKSKLINEEMLKLKMLHDKFGKEYKYGAKLDGMYLQYDMLGKMNNDIEKYPYVKNASLCEAGYFDINYVTWWSLKEYEMAIGSPSIKDELSEISFSDVIQTMKYNLNEYWLSKLETSEIFEQDMWVEFAVVTLSRIIYTLQEGEIKSKSQSCSYIANEYPEWNDIIQEALAIRNLESQSIIGDINVRKDRTIDFINEMIQHGNMLINSDRIIRS
ncbi:MAG: DUF4111 domain-containing protein [Vallitalea sp.]|jgi:hypothetical protein|nr:DUF4111 domain-containing protein [Vallitalea sp.]